MKVHRQRTTVGGSWSPRVGGEIRQCCAQARMRQRSFSVGELREI